MNRFNPGQVVATPGALAALEASGASPFRRKEMLKILVAEDDRNLAQYYVTLLSQWNCETVVEHTGTDAIRRAATFRPDVALLGVVIPAMGGVEAAIK